MILLWLSYSMFFQGAFFPEVIPESYTRWRAAREAGFWPLSCLRDNRSPSGVTIDHALSPGLMRWM